MAKNSKFNKNKKKKKYDAVIGQLLALHGYKILSFKNIAEEIGIPPANVQTYYKTKYDIIFAAIDENLGLFDVDASNELSHTEIWKARYSEIVSFKHLSDLISTVFLLPDTFNLSEQKQWDLITHVVSYVNKINSTHDFIEFLAYISKAQIESFVNNAT